MIITWLLCVVQCRSLREIFSNIKISDCIAPFTTKIPFLTQSSVPFLIIKGIHVCQICSWILFSTGLFVFFESSILLFLTLTLTLIPITIIYKKIGHLKSYSNSYFCNCYKSKKKYLEINFVFICISILSMNFERFVSFPQLWFLFLSLVL